PNTLAQTLYCPGTNLPPIYEGFSGWDLGSNCYVKVATSIFLPNRSCVTFNYTMPFNQPLPPVQVSKEGRSLRLIDTELYGQGHRKAVKQTFCAGKTAGSPFSYYRIGWVKMDDYGTSKSLPIKLKWISVSSDYMKCLATGINHGNQN
ncbi:MAG: hypothetical protein KGJ11_10165, partial [Candidatus Omnitrophica bacterium]|nr:hypothetical protein [Candidatus Omnitrophota bacterium]